MNALWPRIGVMGGGAIGCLYGGLLARAGAPVSIVGRKAHVDAIRARGLRVSGRDFDFHTKVTASTEIDLLSDSEVLLFCTKTRDTEKVAAEVKQHLKPGAIVLAFQNGVEGVERLSAILPNDVFPAALVVSCHIEGPGHVHHNGRGEVILGEWFSARSDVSEREERLRTITEVLSRASIKTAIAADIRLTMWTKLAMNCAYNALSALGRARYLSLATTEPSITLMRQVVEELVAVGRADAVNLDLATVLKQVMDLANGMPEAISSTAQDIAASRPTEIDDLNGFVVRRGRARGVPTPTNETLQLLIQVLEQAPSDPAFLPKNRG